jgi:hypothetical protein
MVTTTNNLPTESREIINVSREGRLRSFEAVPIDELVEQVQLIQSVMSRVMKSGEHYGIVPGTSRKDKDGKEEAKPSLLKPGAEKLGFVFRLAPEFQVTITDLHGGHRDYQVTCRLTSINTGAFIGEGIGSCSTHETKYRYRNGRRKCPECGKETIVQTKKGRNPGGYWCVPDKGGCGANFDPGDPDVEQQQVGKVDNPDPADVYNTVLKMAKKRAHVDAILTATAASDIFTQDVEDMGLGDVPAAPPEEEHTDPASIPGIKRGSDIKPPTITEEQHEELSKLFEERIADVGKTLEFFGIDDLADLPAVEYKPLKSKLSKAHKRQPVNAAGSGDAAE